MIAAATTFLANIGARRADVEKALAAQRLQVDAAEPALSNMNLARSKKLEEEKKADLAELVLTYNMAMGHLNTYEAKEMEGTITEEEQKQLDRVRGIVWGREEDLEMEDFDSWFTPPLNAEERKWYALA